MAWYNPLSWFARERESASSSHYDELFYCANPQCHLPIKESTLAYEPVQRVVVHEGDCQSLFFAWQAFNSGEGACGSFDFISREQAIGLARRGEIDSRCLEKKV